MIQPSARDEQGMCRATTCSNARRMGAMMSSRLDQGNELPRKMAPDPYSFLPAPKRVPQDPSDPPEEGWWNDPLSSDSATQRYYDGEGWTPYICGRTARNWTDIFPDRVNTEIDPEALRIPRPPAVPEPAPDPPTAGWWEDPIERKLKQARYFDGTEWTDLLAPTKSAGPRLVTRRRDPKEVVREQKAAQAAAKAQSSGSEPGKRRWPWSRHVG
jgi:hypothetical protein